MKRSNPYWNISRLAVMGVMVTAVTLALLLTGWQAFSPGPLTALAGRNVSLGGFATHAEFERQCALCHQPFEREMSDLCLDCHTNVRAQIQEESGLHGKVNPSTRCVDCHPDHAGREFSIGKAALPHFDRLSMHFSLGSHALDYAEAPIGCTGCHNPDDPAYVPVTGLCQDCHAAEDAAGMQEHVADYGSTCLDCHDGVDRMSGLDHASTGFKLDWKHAELACVDCHTGAAEKGPAMFAGLSSACIECHEEPQMHAGYFGMACEVCHTAMGWLPVTWDDQAFDHLYTGFSLAKHAVDYAGTAITCKLCHPDTLGEFSAQACIDCHRAERQTWMDVHKNIMGKSCVGCHDGADRMAEFDHNQFFPLEGKHLKAVCYACHGANLAEEVFRGLPGQCVDCHQEPALHAGTFGVECQHCHDALAWSPAYLRDHVFPFDHGGATLTDCRLCHTATYTDYACDGCHEHQAAEMEQIHSANQITGERLQRCMDCHAEGSRIAED